MRALRDAFLSPDTRFRIASSSSSPGAPSPSAVTSTSWEGALVSKNLSSRTACPCPSQIHHLDQGQLVKDDAGRRRRRRRAAWATVMHVRQGAAGIMTIQQLVVKQQLQIWARDRSRSRALLP